MSNFNQINLNVEQFDKSEDFALFDFITLDEFLYIKSNGNKIPDVKFTDTEPTMIMVRGIKNVNMPFTEGITISVPADELLQATQRSSSAAAHDNVVAYLIANDERFNTILSKARITRGFE